MLSLRLICSKSYKELVERRLLNFWNASRRQPFMKFNNFNMGIRELLDLLSFDFNLLLKHCILLMGLIFINFVQVLLKIFSYFLYLKYIFVSVSVKIQDKQNTPRFTNNLNPVVNTDPAKIRTIWQHCAKERV